MSFPELCKRVRAQIAQDHRYEHTVRVARCADVLAQRHGFDARKARLAGMLHDLARLYPADRLLAECEARGMPIDDFERAHPVVLHARLGAQIARESFGVEDPEVLSAIEKHTVAAPEMSRLDIALYLADGLEPGRKYAERGPLWEIAMRDLDEGMRQTLRFTFGHMARKGIPPSPQTLAAAQTYDVPVPEEV